MPLAAALSLVVLACWGVLLVTRRTVRRVVAVLGLLAAAGLAATVVAGWLTLPDAVRDTIAEQTGVGRQRDRAGGHHRAGSGRRPSAPSAPSSPPPWRSRWVPHWPEMGSRYDAPGAADADPGARGREQPGPVEGHGRGSRPHRVSLLNRLSPHDEPAL